MKYGRFHSKTSALLQRTTAPGGREADVGVTWVCDQKKGCHKKDSNLSYTLPPPALSPPSTKGEALQRWSIRSSNSQAPRTVTARVGGSGEAAEPSHQMGCPLFSRQKTARDKARIPGWRSLAGHRVKSRYLEPSKLIQIPAPPTNHLCGPGWVS